MVTWLLSANENGQIPVWRKSTLKIFLQDGVLAAIDELVQALDGL